MIVALLAGACAPRAVNAPPLPPPAADEARAVSAQVAAAEPEGPAESANSLRGRILVVLDAAPYTYLQIETQGGVAWAAVPAFAARAGTDVVVSDVMPMVNFESKTLGRRFDVVYFGQVGPREPAPEPQPEPPPIPSLEGIAPATGPDARTVAQLWAQRTALAGASVEVRGKVVKNNAGIMGGNWYHLRDGTGSPGERNNDLTVITPTSAPMVPVGEVVTFKGTVAVEKDFGAGYAYPVILLDARAVE